MLHLPFSLELQILPDLSRLVRQDVFKLLLLLSEHLNIALRELDLLVNLTNHLLKALQLCLETALLGHVVSTGSASLSL